MNNPPDQGFTLIELLLVITILAIAIGLGTPAMGKLAEHHARTALLNDLLTGINHARTQAVMQGVNVTLCPLDQHHRCSGDWNQPITVFRDAGRTRTLNRNSDILHVVQAPGRGKLYGRTGIRKHFAFRPSGLARDSIGHFLWCPDDGEAENAFQVRINMGGRPAVAQDSNGDGIAEDAYGQNIICP